jgi:hypothetical protein
MLRRQGSKTPAFQALKPSTERNRSFEQDHRHLCRVSPTRPDSQEASRSRNPGFKESVSSKRHFKTPVCFKATLVYVMQLRVKRATPRDIPDITALWKLVVQRLGSRLGHPAWSKFVMPEGIYREMHRATVYIVREGDAVIAAFTLSMQKPWSLDEAQFKPATRALYLTDLAVHPHRLHRGIELLCIRAAIRIARSWLSDSLRLGTCEPEVGESVLLSTFGFRTVGTDYFGERPTTVFELSISGSSRTSGMPPF